MKNSKFTMKKLLVVGLAIILVVLCISSTSFSWFERPKSRSGNSLKLDVSENAYDGGGVTMVTYISTNDGISFSDDNNAPVDFTDEDNRKVQLGTSDISDPINRVYYKTILTNDTGKDQNVSLYLKNFRSGSTGEVCIGVNKPIKAFKNYSHYNAIKPDPSKTSAAGDGTKRVYFDPIRERTEDTSATWDGGDYSVCYGTSTDDIDVPGHPKYITLSSTGTEGVYYADLPADTNKLFFCVTNWGGNNYKRTQTFTNLSGDGLSQSQSLYFKLNGTYTSYNNAWSAVNPTSKGANIMEYYNTAQLGVNESIDISLSEDQFTADTDANNKKKISYSSDDESVATVSTAGVVTGVSGGTANITYTVTSDQGDTRTAVCAVTVNAYASEDNTIANAPIVTNLLIPGSTADNANKQEVTWFIQNGDEMYGRATDNANVSFDSVYLGV